MSVPNHVIVNCLKVLLDAYKQVVCTGSLRDDLVMIFMDGNEFYYTYNSDLLSILYVAKYDRIDQQIFLYGFTLDEFITDYKHLIDPVLSLQLGCVCLNLKTNSNIGYKQLRNITLDKVKAYEHFIKKGVAL